MVAQLYKNPRTIGNVHICETVGYAIYKCIIYNVILMMNDRPPVNNGYPPINPPTHMHQPMDAQGNPSAGGGAVPPGVPYPRPYGGPGEPPPPPHTMPGSLGVRTRDWDAASRDGMVSERDKKRPRPGNPSGIPPPPPSSYPPNAMMHGAYNPTQTQPHGPIGYQPPHIPFHGVQNKNPPANYAPIHQPPMPFQNRPNIAAPHGPMPMAHPTAGAGVPSQPPYPSQYPSKGHPPFNRQPPGIHPSLSQDRIQAPPSVKDGSAVPNPNMQGDRAGSSQASPNEPESFKEFLARQPDAISPLDAKELYDQYVRDFAKKRPSTFFDLHKHEEWFRERYDPDYVLARCSRIQKECQDRAGDYKKLWDLGGSALCAPDISSASRGSDAPPLEEFNRKEDFDIKEQEKPSPDSSLAKNEPEEVKSEEKDTSKAEGHQEDKDDKKQMQGEESGVEGKVEKDEDEVPKEKEINAKEEYVEETIMEDEEGVMNEDSELKKEDIQSQDENKLKDDEALDEDKALNDDEALKDNEDNEAKKMSNLVLPLRREHEKHTIFLRGIPINLKREDLTAILAHGEHGDMNLELRRVKIGDINPTRQLQRFAWAVYADEESAARALTVVRGVAVKSTRKKPANSDNGELSNEEKDPSCEYVIDCMLNLERKKKYSQGRILPEVFGTTERMKVDVEQSVDIMRFLDTLRKIDPSMNPLTDEFIASLPSDGRRLDHILTYLRETHYYCYYSGNEFLEDATSMPPQELRPLLKDDKLKPDTDMRMAKRVDERTKWVLERDYDRPRSNSDNAEKARREAVEAWLNANTVNEGEGRYRCNLPPNKLFKAPEFVHKHLKSRHADRMKEVSDKAYEDVYRANFENDPSKDEVISIYNEGAGAGPDRGPPSRGARGSAVPPTNAREGNFGGNVNSMNGQVRPAMPVGMFNPATAYMGLGMQPMPMMMMPQTGFSYPNSMAFGRGMNAPSMGPRMGPPPDMGRGRGMHGPHVGKDDMGGGGPMWRRGGGPGGRGEPFEKDGRNGRFHEGGLRDNAGLRGPPPHRGGRRGGGSRRGGHRFESHGEPLDPRAMGPRRNYTDLDAPAKGPSFDIVRYDDI